MTPGLVYCEICATHRHSCSFEIRPTVNFKIRTSPTKGYYNRENCTFVSKGESILIYRAGLQFLHYISNLQGMRLFLLPYLTEGMGSFIRAIPTFGVRGDVITAGCNQNAAAFNS